MLFRRDIVNYILRFLFWSIVQISSAVSSSLSFAVAVNEELSPVLRQSTAEFMKNVPTSNIVFLQMKSLE